MQGEKLAAQRSVAEAPMRESSASEIRLLLADLGDVRDALERGQGAAKAELYSAFGLTMTFHLAEQVVDVVAVPTRGGLKSVSEGGRLRNSLAVVAVVAGCVDRACRRGEWNVRHTDASGIPHLAIGRS